MVKQVRGLVVHEIVKIKCMEPTPSKYEGAARDAFLISEEGDSIKL